MRQKELLALTCERTMVEGAATRFDSAAELIGSIEKLYGDVSAQTGRVANPYFIKLLRGEAVPPMYPAQVAVKPYSGAGVVVDELLTMTIGMVKGIVAPNHLASSALMLPAPETAALLGGALIGFSLNPQAAWKMLNGVAALLDPDTPLIWTSDKASARTRYTVFSLNAQRSRTIQVGQSGLRALQT